MHGATIKVVRGHCVHSVFLNYLCAHYVYLVLYSHVSLNDGDTF